MTDFREPMQMIGNGSDLPTMLPLHPAGVLKQMSIIRKLFDEVTKKGLTPLLKADGYKKKGSNFRKDPTPTVLWLVNVQSSQWNNPTDGNFTINLGIFHRDLAALHDMLSGIQNPLTRHCLVQSNLGTWSLDSKTDLDALANAIAESWRLNGRKWMEHFSSLIETRTFFVDEQKTYFLAAMASHVLKEDNATRYWLARAIEENPVMRDKFLDWERKHLGKG
jgi:hypothetical protein